MAKNNKITIRVSPGRRTETISWQGAGSFGTLVLSKSSGQLLNQPLTTGVSENAYWNAILAAVLPHLV